MRSSEAAATILLCLCGLSSAASCGKSSTAPTLSPPLPPAEEPAPDDEGAYVPDGGASSDERDRSGDTDDTAQ